MLIFAVSIAAVVGIALYISRDAIARKKTPYDRGAYESQRDRDYEKYHSEWGDETAEGHAGTGDLGAGEDGDPGDDEAEFAPRGAGAGQAAGYYGVLGVGRDAAQDEIKRRYRELAKEAHPDRAGAGGGGDAGGAGGGGGGDAGRRMALINEAYDVLSDPGRRRRYDLWLGRRGA